MRLENLRHVFRNIIAQTSKKHVQFYFNQSWKWYGNWRENLAVVFSVILISSGSLVVFPSRSAAEFSTEDKDAFVTLYLGAAFANKDSKLRKLLPQKLYKVNVVCASMDCSTTIEKLKLLSPAKKFEITLSAAFDVSAPISLALVDEPDPNHPSNSSAFLDSSMFSIGDGETHIDDVSLGCASFTLADATKYKRVVVVAKNMPDWRRNLSCLMSQLGRGSGLSFKETFEALWNGQYEGAKRTTA